jgi:hypothetical protein
MAKRDVRHAGADLYERDYYAWVQRQLELLRAGRLQDVDLDNLIEEVEDLGKSERNTVMSCTDELIQHLLKLQLSPARELRHGWRKEVRAHRKTLKRRLTSTLRHHLSDALGELFDDARGSAAMDLALDGVREADIPQSCPYTLDQILDLDWLPENVHLVRDGTE